MDDALTAIGQKIIIELGDKVCSLGLPRGGQHLACTLTGNLGQRVKDRTRPVKQADRGIVVHGVLLLREVLAGFDTRHDTPPSQASSPIFSHSP